MGELYCTRHNEIIRRGRAAKPEELAKAPWLKRHPIPTADAYRVGKFETDWTKKWLGKWRAIFDARVADGNFEYPWELRDYADDDPKQ